MAPRETGSAPKHYRGQEIYEDVQKISTVAGKRKRDTPTSDAQTQIWKKNSILWELPYWKDLDVHHCIDVMHIEKNVCDALLGTLLNMKGRSKDHRNARKDLQERGLRPELVPEGDDEDLPTSCVTLSKKEKKGLCEFFKSVKVPFGYSAYIPNLVSVPNPSAMNPTKAQLGKLPFGAFLASFTRTWKKNHTHYPSMTDVRFELGNLVSLPCLLMLTAAFNLAWRNVDSFWPGHQNEIFCWDSQHRHSLSWVGFLLQFGDSSARSQCMISLHGYLEQKLGNRAK